MVDMNSTQCRPTKGALAAARKMVQDASRRRNKSQRGRGRGNGRQSRRGRRTKKSNANWAPKNATGNGRNGGTRGFEASSRNSHTTRNAGADGHEFFIKRTLGPGQEVIVAVGKAIDIKFVSPWAGRAGKAIRIHVKVKDAPPGADGHDFGPAIDARRLLQNSAGILLVRLRNVTEFVSWAVVKGHLRSEALEAGVLAKTISREEGDLHEDVTYKLKAPLFNEDALGPHSFGDASNPVYIRLLVVGGNSKAHFKAGANELSYTGQDANEAVPRYAATHHFTVSITSTSVTPNVNDFVVIKFRRSTKKKKQPAEEKSSSALM